MNIDETKGYLEEYFPDKSGEVAEVVRLLIKSDDQLRKLLKDIKLMVCQKGLEYFASWKQVPKEYQEKFKQYVYDKKQQDFTDGNNWHIAWESYGHEFIARLVDEELSK